MNILNTSTVAISAEHKSYRSLSPYSPNITYPEYPFDSSALSQTANPAYQGVRETMRLMGLDASNYDSTKWNPLGDIIHPENTVVLKPNFVRHFRDTHPHHANCLITHGSVIRAVLDYVYIALAGQGRIVIADAPHNDADFDEIVRIAGLGRIQNFYHQRAGFDVEVYDLRPQCARKIDGIIVGHATLPGDPAGYAMVNLGKESAFAEINHLCQLLYGSEYDTSELYRHQHDDVHEYLIARQILEADCVISLPKLKTHKKTGITVNMKNLVGINGNKNLLPHHREGTPAQGGDQFADNGFKHHIERSTVMQFKRFFPILGPLRPVVAGPIKALGKRLFGDTNTDTIRSGNWYGNDTTWRMVIDLNRILLYADAHGNIHDRPVRNFFSFVDGIVAGEGNGPLDPIPKPAGVIVAGGNPLAVDLTCARLMGFDFQRLPLLYRAFDSHPHPLLNYAYNEIDCRSNNPQYHRPLTEFEGSHLRFKPHFGWQGQVEYTHSNSDMIKRESCVP